MTIYFDVETSGLPESELLATMPPFDPADVKCGNLKDPEKIAAKLAEAESAHRRDYLEGAALDALTGRVLAVGFATDGDVTILDGGGGDEAELLRAFWNVVTCSYYQGAGLVGFNVCAFDLPFLVKRSWKHSLAVPLWLREGRWWSKRVVDLREAWQMGDRQAKGSLDAVARHLGVGRKVGDGKDFARLWAEDRPAAVAYLENDVRLVRAVAERMGVS